jgi:chromosome partition protein MukE
VTDHGYERLEEVIQDPIFPEVDLALRAGEHVDSNDADRYTFLAAAQALLEPLYLRYGAELIRSPDGFFFLLPRGDRLGRRHLSTGEMLLGQALALMYLDPATVQAAGVVSRAQAMELLANLVGEQRLVGALNPRRRRHHEHVSQELARKELDRALRSLCALGFIELLDDEKVRLRSPLMRFAEPVRGLADPSAALQRLARRGLVDLLEPDPSEEPPEEEGDEG